MSCTPRNPDLATPPSLPRSETLDLGTVDFMTAFADHLRLKGNAIHTIGNYSADVGSLLRFCGQVSPAAITPDDVARWDAWMAGKYRHNTRARRRNGVRRFFAFLEAHHNIPSPAREINVLRVQDGDPYLLHPDHFLEILRAQDERDPVQARDGALIAFLACTGVRRSEAIALRMRDVAISGDGKNWIAQVPTLKKGGQDIHLGPTRIINFGNIEKTGDIATTHFGLWFVNRLGQFGGRTSRQALGMPLFARTMYPSAFLSPQALHDCVTRACRRTGNLQLERVTVHTLRHFFATQCVINGMTLPEVQYYLGHAHIETTQRYIHLKEKMTGAAARLHGPTVGLQGKDTLTQAATANLRTALRQLVPRIPI